MCPNCTDMRYLLLSSLLALVLAVSAQIPDYVPTDGLIAWYPFDGNANDESGNGFHGDAQYTTATIDRNGVEDAALKFNGMEGGGGSSVVIDHTMLNVGQEEYSIHLWFRPANLSQISRALFNTIPHTGIAMTFNNNNSPSYVSYLLGPADAIWDYYYVHGSFNDYQTNGWYALTLTKQGADYKKYLNGVLESAYSAPLSENYNHDVAFRISGISADVQIFDGDLDDVGFWNRALTQQEVFALHNEESSTTGCTDASACNFNAEANLDDESCEYGCLNCGPGTVWDGASELCVIANPSDTDFDGCVGMTDLLDLLSVFGTCNEVPWSCGDPLEYQGYDYETVQIGEQCWFAENLRATSYRNGEGLLSGLGQEEWLNTSEGALANMGAAGSSCQHYHPDFDACDQSISLFEFGLLYNGYAVGDGRGLCPSGWKIPSDEDFMVLESHLGMAESELNDFDWRGTDEGVQMKSMDGWSAGGAGVNSSGFNVKSAGYRRADSGAFNGAGYFGHFWTSTSEIDGRFNRKLDSAYDGVKRNVVSNVAGFSIRCIQDSE